MAINPKVPYVIKGKDYDFAREAHCGCLVKGFPLPEDSDLLDWLIVHRTQDMEDKWSMQLHKHKDFQEYWFVIEGKGKFYIGDDVFDVEAGDLAVMPRDVPHKAEGNITFVCTMALHNVHGKTIGRKMQYEGCDEPNRDDPKMRAPLGEYLEKKM